MNLFFKVTIWNHSLLYEKKDHPIKESINHPGILESHNYNKKKPLLEMAKLIEFVIQQIQMKIQ
jgi:hypothetical protein